MLNFSHNKVRRFLAVSFVLLLLSVISFYFNSFVETHTISYVDSDVEIFDITSKVKISQPFVAHHSRLSFVDVRIHADNPLHMNIYDDQGELVARSKSTSLINDKSDYIRFHFDQNLRVGREYSFYIPDEVFLDASDARIWGSNTSTSYYSSVKTSTFQTIPAYHLNTHIGYVQTHYGLYIAAIILAILCGLSIMVDLSVKIKNSIKIPIIMLFLLPLITFVIVEILNGQTFLMKSFQAYVLNYLFYTFLYFSLFAAINRFHISAITSTVILFGIGVANHLKLGVRGEPLQVWDLFTIRTALNVSEHYSMPISAVLIIAFLVLFLIGSFLVRFRFSILSKKRRIALGSWSIALSALVIVFLFSLGTFSSQEHIDDSSQGIVNITWNQNANYGQNGLVVALAMNVREAVVREPDGYDIERIDNIAENIDIIHDNDVVVKEESDRIIVDFFDENANQDEIKPNIIVIMNESYADLQRIEIFETNQTVLPQIERLSDDLLRGDLYVSTYGGGTANSEFEFLTGHSMAFLPQGSVPYEQYISDQTHALPKHLSDLGYETIAIHAYLESGWNRTEVYDIFGFDHAFFIDDFTEPEMIRDYVSDAETYRLIKSLLENKESDEPLFIFNITMQNHGPYDYEEFFSSDDVYIQDYPEHFPETEQYLTLLYLSDEAIADLILYLSDFEEPTIVLFFGDHLPTMNNGFYEMLMDTSWLDFSPQQMQMLYRTDYFFWANYELFASESMDISLNYLSVRLLEYAGLPLSEYQIFLRDLMQDFPVITPMGIIDSQNRRYDCVSLIAKRDERIENYSFLVYNDLFDDEDRRDEFFDSFEYLDNEINQ